MIRHGKPSAALLRHKQSFFEDNDRLLSENRRLAASYAAQPKREKCKNCTAPIAEPSFVKLGVAYSQCPRCGHLNGMHEDTDAFCATVYTDTGGKAYAENYSQQDLEAYRRRVKDIYLPKAEFLCDALRDVDLNPAAHTIADLGAGSGYFVAAAKECGFRAVQGYEVSEVQVGLADAMIGEGALRRHNLDETVKIASSLEDDIVSMIGVLEHLQHPRDVLGALRDNPKVRFLYISVPLYSMSVHLELAFQNIMQRQLSGGHTHLYTNESIDWMCREYKFERTSEWWFGSDFVDLYRIVSVSLESQEDGGVSPGMWADEFLPVLDAMQVELDKRQLSSEVHLFLRSTT